MRKVIVLLLLLLLLAGCAAAEDYVNPIRVYNSAGQTSDAADNFVLRYNGRYYLYNFSEVNGRCYVSDDLVHWQYVGYTFAEEYPNITFFAPEVMYWRGQFLMLTSPRSYGHSILVSDSPTGPFRLATDNFGYDIDGSLFARDDGSLWMVFPQDLALSMVEIDPDTLTPKGLNFRTGATLYDWTEGPGVFRRGDYYFLTYTGNHYLSAGYRVGWSSRKNDPVGRYESLPDNIILINSVFGDPFKGLGHSSNVVGPDLDSLYTAYHAHAPLDGGTAPGQYAIARWYCLDRLLTNGGMLYTTGASSTAMPVPSMPDVYGDVRGDAGSWVRTASGWMADVPAALRFTQECNFALTGGTMAWRMGSANGDPVLVETDGAMLTLHVGETVVREAPVPELGEAGRLHTLRIENTPELTHVYIDMMRLMTIERLGVQADTVGALEREGVSYSYMAHTAKTLGDGDRTALKLIPGTFAAVHAAAERDSLRIDTGIMDAQALIPGEADYNVRVAETGAYCFDLTVRAEDAGKQLFLAIDGGLLLETVIPHCPDESAQWFTYTTQPVELPAGDHMLTLSGQAAVWMIESFAQAEMPVQTWDLARNDRQGIITLGNFFARNGTLCISGGKSGYALIGEEGCTDYEMRVRFMMPGAGSGTAGFLLRATDVALYEKPVEDELFGYMISVSPMGMTVRRAAYGARSRTEFIPVAAWNGQTEGELILRVQGSRMEILLPDSAEPVFTLNDATPYSHGLCGLYSTGKEFAVTELSVRPVKE